MLSVQFDSFIFELPVALFRGKDLRSSLDRNCVWCRRLCSFSRDSASYFQGSEPNSTLSAHVESTNSKLQSALLRKAELIAFLDDAASG